MKTISFDTIKLFIIGLDGATFDIIDPLIEAGKLPNLAQLINEGCSGNLRSTLPPMTYPAWNAFMTGTNPGKHGVLDFTERKPNSFELRFTSAAQRKQPTIWRILSDAGKFKQNCLSDLQGQFRDKK